MLAECVMLTGGMEMQFECILSGLAVASDLICLHLNVNLIDTYTLCTVAPEQHQEAVHHRPGPWC